MTLDDYLSLITSEHADKPRLRAMITIFAQWVLDRQALLSSMPGLFDLDVAVDAQLDTVGLWVGRSRQVVIPITGVYFAWDTSGVGWDEGFWQGPFDPNSGLVSLPNDPYRTLLRANIARNHWDGTIPGAYDIWDELFQGALKIIIQDNQDMTMDVGVILPAGQVLDPITKSLLVSGELDLRPMGVLVNGYFQNSVPGGPVFSWDVDPPTATEAGWDLGNWAIPLS